MQPNPIREARKKQHISQLELAQVIGVAPSQMSRYESGQRRIRLDEARKIANKLRISVSDILGEDSPIGERTVSQGTLVTLPLPEGRVILEFPADLSPESREALKSWLQLIATVAGRE